MNEDKLKQEFKAKLAERVEAAVSGGATDAHIDGALKTKGNHQGNKECSVCGKSYRGRADATTCGAACRKAKSRA